MFNKGTSGEGSDAPSLELTTVLARQEGWVSFEVVDDSRERFTGLFPVPLEIREGRLPEVPDTGQQVIVPLGGVDHDWQSVDREGQVTGLGEVTEPDGPRVLVLSNQAGQPFVTAGAAFPLEVVRLAGGQDASEALGMNRTGPISAEQVIAAEPDAILLVDMNGTGEQIFEPLLSNAAVAELPAVAEDRVLLVEGREVQALGFADTVQARDRIAEWLAN